MKENALSSLEDIGFLKANIDQNVKKNFLPWLLQESAVYHQ